VTRSKSAHGKRAKDNLIAGDGIRTARAAWDFGGETVGNFDSHLRSSIPLYQEGHDLVCSLSDFFVQKESVCYELGTSLGTLLKQLAERHGHKEKVRWIGVDCEEDMIRAACKDLGTAREQIQFLTDDINLLEFQKSDLIIAYYTIQFVPPRLRQQLIDRIYEALNWGGAFICFEKVRANDARFQDYMTALYTDYKLEQGYSPEEIVNKAQSLKSVLEPFSTQGNLDLFARAGFVDVLTVQKYVCFEGFLCIK
jgi:tRNA (cmo5U34)-methyltransferase